MTYRVKEVFRTIQGEGYHVGKVATFVRFTACNMWSGREADRYRDSKRNGAECPLWCDTDFVGGEAYELDALVEAVVRESDGATHVVLSGGEPLLQVDSDLLHALHDAGLFVQIETNGTAELKGDGAPMPWITMSPKVSRERTVLPWAHELKLIYPAYSPMEWATFDATYRFLQPLADGDRIVPAHVQGVIDYCRARPDQGWRVGLQTHKILRIP